MKRGLPVRLALLALVAGCAQMEPPPGGPLDKDPATLAGALPPDGTINTGPLESYELRFSEPVNRASVEAALRSDPPRLPRQVAWKGDTLAVVRLWDPFPADTTVALFLAPGWKDLHGVAQTGYEIVHFATGARLLPGWLGGQVSFKGQSSARMHLRLSELEGDSLRAGRPDRSGAFVFRHLPVDGRFLSLLAFEDVDGDSLFDPSVDFADTLRDSLFLSAEEPRRLDLRIDVIDPDEPGRLTGSFACGDTLPGFFLLRLHPDSLWAAPDSAPGPYPQEWSDSLRAILAGSWEGPCLERAEPGDFQFGEVPPGDWALFVHKELGSDSLWSEGEPAWLSGKPLVMEPGGELSLPPFIFPPPDSVSAESLAVRAERQP